MSMEHEDVAVEILENVARDFKSERLFNSSQALSVVAICGHMGSGKTTFARLLYNDPEVSHHFGMRVWCNVNTVRGLTEILVKSLTSASDAERILELESWNQIQLVQWIRKELPQRKYLIVLDGVCRSHDIWNNVLNAVLSENNNGSRIIVTTQRPEDAAGWRQPDHVHQMEPLTEAEKWKLFKQRSGKRDADLQIEIRDWINLRTRLPLEIVLVAGMFSGNIARDRNMMPHVSPEGGLNNILCSSYRALPSHLKKCLDYMGQFPPEKGISVEKLCLLWMAEGMTSEEGMSTTMKRHITSLLEVAKYNYSQLIASNLVIEDNVLASLRFPSCKILPCVQDMCRVERERNDSVVVLDVSERDKRQTINSAKELKEYLRKRPKSLKYLSFQGCDLPDELPPIISEFTCLETLDLRVIVVVSALMSIPNVLCKLSKLKHLYFPQAFKCAGSGKLKLDELTDLEILENFDANSCDSDDLAKLAKLQILTCIVHGGQNNTPQDLDNIRAAMEKINCKLNESQCNRLNEIQRNQVNQMQCNHYTSLVVQRFNAISARHVAIVKGIFQCQGINLLDIEGYLGNVTDLDHIGSNFIEIVLNHSEFTTFNPLPQLGRLPNLRSLVLCNDALKVNEIHFRGKSFTKLTSLRLEALGRLQTLVVEEGALPKLATLTIAQCNGLEMPLGGLKEMKALEELRTNPDRIDRDDVSAINRKRQENGYKSLTVMYL